MVVVVVVVDEQWRRRGGWRAVWTSLVLSVVLRVGEATRAKLRDLLHCRCSLSEQMVEQNVLPPGQSVCSYDRRLRHLFFFGGGGGWQQNVAVRLTAVVKQG